MIIRKYCNLLYVNKFNNLDEIDILIQIYLLPKETQEEIEYLYKPIASEGIKLVIKKSPTKKKKQKQIQVTSLCILHNI